MAALYAGEDAEKVDYSTMVEINSVVSHKIKHKPILWPSNSIPRYLSKRN